MLRIENIIKWLSLMCLSFGSLGVLACSCMPQTIEQQYEAANKIYVAVLFEKMEEAKGKEAKGKEAKGKEAKGKEQALYRDVEGQFSVLENIKGETPEVVTLTTANSSAACGVNFSLGRTYLIFEHQAGRVNLCSGTRTIDDKDQELLITLRKLKVEQ